MKLTAAILCMSCLPAFAQKLVSQAAFAPPSRVVTYYQLCHRDKGHVKKLLVQAIGKIQKRHFAEARSLLESAIASDRGCWDAHINLGAVYFWEGDRRSARMEFETATALDPVNALGYADLAVCDLRSGRPESAFSLAKKALRLDPANELAIKVLKVEQGELK